MTVDGVIKELENYYGAYSNPKVKDYVKAYLYRDHKPEKLESVLKSIIYYHKASFKAPCIASIEECVKLAKREKDLSKKGTNTDRYNYSLMATKDPAFKKVTIDLMADIRKKYEKKENS